MFCIHISGTILPQCTYQTNSSTSPSKAQGKKIDRHTYTHICLRIYLILNLAATDGVSISCSLQPALPNSSGAFALSRWQVLSRRWQCCVTWVIFNLKPAGNTHLIHYWVAVQRRRHKSRRDQPPATNVFATFSTIAVLGKRCDRPQGIDIHVPRIL